MWSLRRCTKSLLQALRDPFTGSNTTKTSNLSSGWIRLSLQLRKVLGPYVEKCNLNYCINIIKNKINLKTGLFVYIMTVLQVDSSYKPSL